MKVTNYIEPERVARKMKKKLAHSEVQSLQKQVNRETEVKYLAAKES